MLHRKVSLTIESTSSSQHGIVATSSATAYRRSRGRVLGRFSLLRFRRLRAYKRERPPVPEIASELNPFGDDPRRTFDTPFLNVRPDVMYVGDAACLNCHHEICDKFHAHPMGRSLVSLSEAKPPASKFGSFNAVNLQYEAKLLYGRVIHTERAIKPDGSSLAERTAEIRYQIGSGGRGHSYLIEDNGYLRSRRSVGIPRDKHSIFRRVIANATRTSTGPSTRIACSVTRIASNQSSERSTNIASRSSRPKRSAASAAMVRRRCTSVGRERRRGLTTPSSTRSTSNRRSRSGLPAVPSSRASRRAPRRSRGV